MPVASVDVETFLTIDLGSINTRASLFDVVDGEYHFIATGMAASTLDAPFNDIEECVQNAIYNLQEISGRTIINREAQIVTPSDPFGVGIDRMAMTYSAGPELRIVVAGLLPDVSLGSATRLVQTIPGKIVETIGINDRRKPEAQVDAILKSKPDLILISGGTDNGATRSVLKLVELVLLVCKVLPQNSRPKVIYVGNANLAAKVSETLKKWTHVATSSNIRPAFEAENVTGNLEILGDVLTYLRSKAIGGFENLALGCCTQAQPTSHAMGRMVQFLSQINDPGKNVLAIDIGASQTTTAVANKGNLSLNVNLRGMGKTISNLASPVLLEQMLHFSPTPFSLETARDYLWQKSLYPNSIPMTDETFIIEQAALRLLLRLIARELLNHNHAEYLIAEPLLLSGTSLSRLPSMEQCLMTIMDGLQPVGVSTVILDRNNILASLGVIARVNSVLPVQVLGSNAFLNLGTLVTPVSHSRPGTLILKISLEDDSGNLTKIDVHQGSLATLPLKMGQTGRVSMEAINGAVIDPLHDRRSLAFKVEGGYCGIIIDARGRPLILPKDSARRRELYDRWEGIMGINKG